MAAVPVVRFTHSSRLFSSLGHGLWLTFSILPQETKARSAGHSKLPDLRGSATSYNWTADASSRARFVLQHRLPEFARLGMFLEVIARSNGRPV